MKKITTIVSVVVFLICSVLVYAINKEYNAGNFLFNILEKKEVTLSHKEVGGQSLFVDKKANNETKDALLFASHIKEYEVATCTATTPSNIYGPMYSTTDTNAVSRTAVIYPASLLVEVAGQELESIYFERIGATADPSGGTMSFKVYLKEVPNIDFGTGAWTWDTTGATLVYDSNPLTAMSGSLGWKRFAFSTKFIYSGTQNLMVLMEYENTGNTTNVQWKYEYNSPCVDTSNSNTTKYNNNTTGTLSGSLASTNYRRPSIKLEYSTDCIFSPQDLAVSAITTTGATISWNKGGTETAWEYAVQPVGQGVPTSYTSTTSTSVNVTGLSPATNYQVYVRSDCGSKDGKGVWKMETFGTSCGVITSTLWWEGFNSDSASLDCWTIVDENNDSTSPTGNNIWKTSATSYEGSHSMYFYGAQTTTAKLPHNDWLISPTIKMQAGKKYRLKYHYRTTSTTSYDYEFAVLMSTTGSDSTSKFTTPIVPKKKYTPSTAWFEEYLIIDGVNADVNFAWHVTSSTTYTYLYLDNIFIEEVTGCPEPMDLDVKGVGADTVTLFWTDNFGATGWEYYVQKAGGGKPTAGGTATTTKEVTVTKDASGTALEDNTEYEYYVRTSCGGGEYSIWQGPFAFRTQCASFPIPFWEGFNTDSKTLDCWTIVDGNGDSTSPTGSNIWRTYTISPMEGDQQMYFYGTSAGAPHDDWLISPAFTLDATKVYKLTYRYKTSTSYSNDFEVLLSKGGISPSDFTTTILSKTHSSSTEEEETLFIGGISGDVNLAWHVTTPSSATYLYLDDVTLVEVDCVDPMNLGVKDIESNKATIVWEDDFNASWEYVVQKEGDGYPGGAGTSVTANEATVTKTNSGATLKPNVEYEFYVRSKCADGTFGDWIGPFVFKTECSAVSWPFTETFETNSPTVDCWTVLDVGSDGSGTTTKTNTWGLYSSSTYAYEGTYSMRFYGTSAGAPFDDWLISPIIQMKNTDIYQLTYYYRTNASYENNFEVKLSTKGTDPSEFSTTLLASETYKNGVYEKKIVYITGIDGDANIGWHVTASNSSYTYVYLDNIKLEKIDCIGPEDDIIISDLEIDKAKFNWTDTENSQWETYVQAAGSGKPTGSGTLVTSKPVTVTRTNGTGSGNLQPNTEYDFWVRSSCGPGKNSGWVGPFTFRTPCDVQPLPFWEGFNKDSKTIDCWNIIDGNEDSTSSTAGIWHMNATNYEGDQSARFYGSSSANLPHNDWLMSPTFTLDPSKYYRLKYHYRTTSTTSYEYEFEVLLSDSGIDKTSNFTDVVVPKKKYDPSTTWEEKIAIISGVSGNINLAWHVTSSTQYTYVYIDNVFLEEIDCPQPVELGSKDEKEEKATIYWQDNFGSDWEFIVQEAGGSTPLPTATGTTTKNKEVVVTKDKNGDNLASNTEYEFYVRTGCGNGKYGEWSGPYIFKTACGVFTTPFWEGFNNNSNTLECWTIIDGNNDSTSPTSSNIWKTVTTNYEGSHSMYFYGAQADASLRPHDDWLISPTITFEAGKMYRLKYHYRPTSTTTYDYEFEVLLSNSGADTSKFTTSVVPKKKYDPTTAWEEEYVFISGVSGDVNIAWHVTSSTQYTYVYIDNVFIEEVQGCPEPLPVTLGVKDEKSDRVTLLWDDNFGATAWEYYIQEEGGIVPTGTGIATANKETIATLDGTGNTLKPNTDYEFYVRTDCGNGEFSIWQGPYQFTTACGIYDTPFWDGFNTADKTYRCWTIIDGNGDSTSPTGSNIWRLYNTASGVYEGDQSMYFYGLSGKTHDDWLISPTIEMDPSLYVLKYRYKTSATTTYNSSFEILLSSQGVDTTKFTTTVLPTEIYREANWKERVVFFNGISGDVNLGWHVNSTGTTYVYLDDVTIKKVETCPEPYHVTIINETPTSIELEWEQYGGITSWEVIVVNYGEDETATPVQKVTVSGTPKTTVTGLSGGKAYTVYVRAKCEDGKSSSDWSTAVDTGTKAGANDECSGAINIPVNKGMDCEQTVAVSMMGATESALAQPGCSTSKKSDIWFEFTATHEDHTIKLEDWKNLDGKSSVTSLYGAIYDQPCSSMTDAVLCFTFTSTSSSILIRGFTVGQKYYLRLGTTSTTEVRDIFNMCITSSYFLEVSPSGEEYTVDELVKDVLIQSDCDLVSNVRYQVGDGSPATHSVNTLGYFNKNNSVFPFEEGIVLSTSEVQFVPGPFSTAAKGNNPYRWNGDKDINDAINDAGGGPRDDKRVTQLEFDFIPVKDSIKFDYLFASNSYINGCTYTCQNGALFAAWLIDLTTGEGQNLAKIKGTQTPISLYTIWDNEKIKNTTCSSHPELFWNAYYNGNADPLEAPINFAGSTIDMSSETVYVVPGRKYHIKLAVMDFCPTQSHSSAVFFSAGSFDLGNLDLGADLLVETGNAICGAECVTIKSGLGGAEAMDVDVEIQWYKDGVAIPGATEPEYEACESGTYKVVGKYPEINCEVEGEKVIEIWPPISTVVHKPEGMEICRYSLNEKAIDLLSVEAEMFADVEREDYEVSYYLTQEDADQGSEDQMIGTPYVIEGGEDFSVFIRVVDTRTGCYEVFIFRVRQQQGAIPTKPEDVSVCAEYVFPQVNGDQYYYTEPGGQGKEYKVGDVLAEPGEHTIYLLQLNNDEGCYEETVYQVNITAPVTADIFEDETPICQLYELKPLSEHNKYFEEPGGNGRELQPGMLISTAQTIYVYASSDNGLCTDESSFTIDYEDCPIPRGISPNGDGKNDAFDLSLHGVQDIKIYNRWGTEVYSHGDSYTNQWYGQNKDGKQLPDGTYYYVIHAHGKVRTGWVQINK